MNQNDYYAILQVNPGASVDEVRTAYKRLAFRYHPDRSRSPLATQKMQLLNEAYMVLSSPEKRAQYDRELAALASRPPIVWSPVVEQPPPAAETVPYRDPARTQERNEKRVILLRNQLKVLFYLLVITIILFGMSLITGSVNFLALGVLVVFSVLAIVSFIINLRNLAG